MNVKRALDIATTKNETIAIRLNNGEITTGVAEVSTDSGRVKVRTSDGPMWVPYEDIEYVSRVVNTLH